MYQLETVSSIEDIDKDEWDRMIDGHALASHGWLKTVERTSIDDLDPRYIILRDGTDLVAGTVCYLSRSSHRSLTLDNFMFGRLKFVAEGLGLTFLPSLICGPLNCMGKHFLVDSTVSDTTRRQLIRTLLDALDCIASRFASSLCFSYLFEDEADILTLLKARGYSTTVVFPACYLDVEWSSFQGYLAYLKGLSKNAAKQVRKDLNRNRKAGVEVERIRDAASYQSRLFELADKHWYKYNQLRFPYKPDFFAEVQDNFGDDAVIYGAFKDSVLIGFMLLLRMGQTGHALEVGVDHELSQRDATYFNIVYYRPIADAIGQQIQRLYFGRGLPETKMRRGCKRRPSYLCYKAKSRFKNNALRAWFLIHARWTRRKVARQTRFVPRIGQARRMVPVSSQPPN